MKSLVIISLCIVLVWAAPFKQTSNKKSLRNIGSKMTKGQRAKQGQFPWQVAIEISGTSRVKFCGGSIINKEWILTAAHCINEAVSVAITIGAVDLNDERAIHTEADKVVPHEEYDSAHRNDICLIKLKQPLKFNKNVQAIRLSKKTLADNVNVTVSGWGITFDHDIFISNLLNFAHLHTVSNTYCQNIFTEERIFDTMVCAVSNDIDKIESPCSGDSGGPLVVESGGVPELAGVVNFVSANGCESTDPFGYARVASYIDWIREVTGDSNL